MSVSFTLENTGVNGLYSQTKSELRFMPRKKHRDVLYICSYNLLHKIYSIDELRDYVSRAILICQRCTLIRLIKGSSVSDKYRSSPDISLAKFRKLTNYLRQQDVTAH